MEAVDRDAQTRAALELDRIELLTQQMLEATGQAKIIREKEMPNKGKPKNPRYMSLVDLVDPTKADTAIGTVRTRGGN